MTFAWRKWAFGLVTGSAVAAGCTQDFNSFQFVEPSGSGGTPPTPECSTAAECPKPSAECKVAQCTNNTCTEGNASANTPCTENGGKVCDGSGTCVACNKNSDCGADKPVCDLADRKCVGCTKDGDCGADKPVCDLANKTCIQCGKNEDCGADKPICDVPNTTCIECAKNEDCTNPDKPLCDVAQTKCVPEACKNLVKDGSETDIDCGGTDCPKCTQGDDCAVPLDCESNFCKPMSGGAGGAGGAGGGSAGVCEKCTANGDCDATEYCKDLSACVPKLAQGKECKADGDCTTGFCTDGFCCNAKCDGTCEACSKAKNEDEDGKCALIKKDKDPDMECADSAASTCGNAANKGCSGDKKACEVWPSTTQCIAASCDDVTGKETAAANCNGMGACPAVMTKPCGLYTCNGGKTACNTSCAASDESKCKTDAYCKADACTACGANAAVMQANLPAGCDPTLSTNTKCVKTCTGNSCVGAMFVCPAGYECEVRCLGNDDCKNAQFTCPDEFTCTVGCGANGACDGAVIKAGKGGKLDVICSMNTDSCKNTVVECGVNECNVTCAGASKPSMIKNCELTPMANTACKCTKNTCM